MGELADKINATCEAQEQATWPELAEIAERVAADHYRPQIDALRAALEPFAAMDTQGERDHVRFLPVMWDDPTDEGTFAAGDVRAARSAMEGEKP
jgi:hypothetical protein